MYGFKYDEITEGLRGFRANKHIIFYQILHDDEILIIRILHQRMDLKRRMIED
ncbi:MAG: type II toxin-antitoxin system RelE/ParE family toxin [Bacteroidaceae bacterium]|jgi:toxin ParE1/3/4|nr:type II toxin-antitoxin system RelE/ParE family toxin [Bacteroidaceae bacterium]